MSKIILVTGPSGAGKSTVCKEFINTAKGEWAYVNQDELRQLVVAGYASADDYERNWTLATKRQWAVSISICTDIVKRNSDAGINCIVDLYAPRKEFEKWKELLRPLKYKTYVLLPSLETTVIRNAGRSKRARLKERKIRENYALFTNCKLSGATVLDTTKLNAKQSAAII